MVRRRCSVFVAAIAIHGFVLASAANAQKDEILNKGKDEYEWNCSACHGLKARGEGEMSKMLVKPPPDLRNIASRNGGQFPFWRVFAIIAGEDKIAGHETFQMPKYWQRFRADEGRPGFENADFRLLALTHYLESIQDQAGQN